MDGKEKRGGRKEKTEEERRQKEERNERRIERRKKEIEKNGGGWTGRVRELKTAIFPGPPEAESVKVGCVKFSAAIGDRPHYVGMRLPMY
jgi:hypothetical protein